MGLLGRALYSENKQRHLDRWQEKAAVTKGYTTGPECCANNTTLGWRLRAKYLKWKTMEYALKLSCVMNASGQQAAVYIPHIKGNSSSLTAHTDTGLRFNHSPSLSSHFIWVLRAPIP